MKAMILAAGRGERMGALTATLPKPLLSIGSATLLERHLRRLAECGVTDVVVNLSYRGAQIRERLGDARHGVRIAYSEEGEPPLETGGGIIHALPLLGSAPFLLVSSDVLTDFDFRILMRSAERSTLVLVPNPPHHSRGDYGLDAAGVVGADPPLLTYSGIALLRPELFAGYAPGRRPLKAVLDASIARRNVDGVRYEGLWIDVGTSERLAAARRAAEEELEP